MKDGPFRRAVKAVARALRTVDLHLTRFVLNRRGEQRYRLAGTCNGCGRCCEAPAQQVSRLTWHSKVLRKVFLSWQERVNGFVLTEEDARFRIFTFRCTHYEPSTKQCDSYGSRPLICRDYPKNLTYEAIPALFPECSYTVHDKKGAQLKAALLAAGVEPAKLKELEKKLFLGDD